MKDTIDEDWLLPQPCEKCGSEKNIEAYHENDDKPLDTIWLCKKHSTKLHRRKRKEK